MNTACYECRQPGANVLGIHVWNAQPGHLEPWRSLHGSCFNANGYTYGIDVEDLEARGFAFWVDHIGGKAWAEFTDYAQAIRTAVP